MGRDRFTDGGADRPPDAQANLNWSDKGVQRPVKNLGWLQRNASHVENLTYERHPDSPQGATLKASGSHPDRGSFSYEIPFESREIMRDWVGRKRNLQHVDIEDRLRDGSV